MTAPTLAIPDGRLRALVRNDVEAITAYATSPGFFDHVDVPERLRHDYTHADAHTFIDEAGHEWAPTWAIEWQGRVVGTIRLRSAAWRNGEEVGFGLHPDARGHGLATSALQAVMAWCRTEGRPLPWARSAADNDASARLLRRAGFRCVETGPWHHWAPPGEA